MFQPKNFYSVLSPMYYTTKIFGLVPFSIQESCYKSSKINIIWSISLLISLCSYTTISLGNKSYEEKEVVAKVTDIVDAYLSQAGMCSGILLGCIFLNKILNILKDINDFDIKMNSDFNIDINREYRRSKMYITIGLLIPLVSAILFTVTSLLVTLQRFTVYFIGEYLAYLSPVLINSCVEFHFCALVLCLKQRFGWLNDTLTEISGGQNRYSRKCNKMVLYPIKQNKLGLVTNRLKNGSLEDRTVTVFENVRIKHHDLSTISKKLNKAYSIQILIIIMETFTAMTAILYYATAHILHHETNLVNYLIYCGVQLGISVTQLVILVVVCSTTSIEARKTGKLIHRIVSLKIENKCKDELKSEATLFSLQLLHHNVEFTACKMFVINENLIFTVVGAVATYLIIVVQFELGGFLKSEE